MIIRKLTPTFSNLPIKEQTSPVVLPATSKPSPTLSQNKFYKYLAFLLVLIGGYKDVNPEKIETQILITPTLRNISHPKNKKEADIDRQLAHLEEHLFNEHLLNTIDILGDLFEAPNGKGLAAQTLLSKRLTPEIFPVLWNKVFLEGPDEVIVAEFTKPGGFTSDDFGRGLRLILRKEIGGLNTSTLLCLDYNAKTKKLEFPQDFFFNDNRKIIPDAVRMLLQYDVQPTQEELKKYKKSYAVDYLRSGFFGTTISAEIDDTSRVLDFHIYPTRDQNGDHPVGRDGKTISVVSLLSCIGCHESKKGFGSTYTSFEEMQRDIHLQKNQDLAIKHFLEFVEGNKHFDTPQEKADALTNLDKMLHKPKENLPSLLPSGFLEALAKKQNTLTQPSLVLNRYNALSLSAITKNR